MLNRRHVVAGLSALCVGDPSWGGELAQSPRPMSKPAKRAAHLIRNAMPDGHVSYLVLDAETGSVLEGRGADDLVAPASTLKTITALYALAKLGPDHRFVTRLLRHGDHLVLAGGGDPTLNTDDLAELAKRGVAAGLVAPARFSVWGGALPKMDEIAPEQADHLAYNPSLSGMMLNFNRVHLGWQRSDDGYLINAEARGDRYRPKAYTITASAMRRGSPLFTYRQEPAREIWTIATSGMGRAGSRWMPVRLPELYAGDVFQTLCRAEGVVLPTPHIMTQRPEGVEVARHESPPLREILRQMMNYSTNLTAEVVGLHASGATDLLSSAQEMVRWLREQGIEDEFEFWDHSGLSLRSRLTPRMMARVLTLGRDQIRELMRDIPITDGRGKTISSPLKINAKTGTLNFVSNLAGYAGLPGRRSVIFAVYVHDDERSAQSAGLDLPAGVVSWTGRARRLHQELANAWTLRYS